METWGNIYVRTAYRFYEEEGIPFESFHMIQMECLSYDPECGRLFSTEVFQKMLLGGKYT